MRRKSTTLARLAARSVAKFEGSSDTDGILPVPTGVQNVVEAKVGIEALDCRSLDRAGWGRLVLRLVGVRKHPCDSEFERGAYRFPIIGRRQKLAGFQSRNCGGIQARIACGNQDLDILNCPVSGNGDIHKIGALLTESTRRHRVIVGANPSRVLYVVTRVDVYDNVRGNDTFVRLLTWPCA